MQHSCHNFTDTSQQTKHRPPTENYRQDIKILMPIDNLRQLFYQFVSNPSFSNTLFQNVSFQNGGYIAASRWESPNSADFGANRNRTIRKSALNGDLYVLTNSAPFWYKNWQFFWKKPHYIREFRQFSAVLKPH